MRFGGLIAATAWLVAITGAAAQTPNAAAPQTPPAQTTNSEQQEAQPQQIHNPDAESQKAQEKADQANPASKTPAPTAEEEREQKIRQYDPLANPAPQPQNQNGQDQQNQKANQGANGKGGSHAKTSDSAAKSNDGGAAAGGPPGPTVEGDSDSVDDSSAYSGPPVMSRSYSLLVPSIPSQEKWIPVIGINAIYDSGLQGIHNTGANGYTTGGSFGTEMLWGISGRHYFRHDVIGINYRGDIQYYSPAKYFDGSNHWLTLDYTHMFSRHLWLTLVESGSVYSQNYALVNPVTVTEEAATNLNNTPNVQLFDNGWKQANTSMDVTYQKTVRLSFNGGASGFIYKPEAPYLVSSTGASARADVNYRMTRRTTIGAAYSYNNFWFPRGDGRSLFHTMNGVYSWALSKTMFVSAAVGASRLDSTGLSTEYLDPQLAALLGQGSVITQYRSVQWISNYSGQFSKSFHRGRSASISFNRGLSPGNGLYLTSRQQDISVGGSMIVFRHYYFSTGFGYDTLSAATQDVGQYRSTYAFFGASHAMRHGIQANMRLDFRHFDIGNAPALQNTFRVSLGFSWSPIEGLHRLW
jgi:hypothetical protein